MEVKEKKKGPLQIQELIGKDMPKIKMLVETGHTDDFICKLFGVPAVTWKAWQKNHPDFRLALLKWKEYAVNQVEKKLFERAVGYDYKGEKLFYDKDIGSVVRAETNEHVPPDIQAAKFFLTNQAPDKWREKVEVDHDVTGSLADMILKARGRAKPELKEAKTEDEEEFLK